MLTEYVFAALSIFIIFLVIMTPQKDWLDVLSFVAASFVLIDSVLRIVAGV